MIRQRIRIRFRKQEDLRWISHRDLLRTWERLFRRAGLPLSMTEGFHPKPRMNFPSALAVGIAGLEEIVEIELCEERTAEDLAALLPRFCPPGLAIGGVEVLAANSRKPQVRSVTFALPVPPARQGDLVARMGVLLSESAHWITRELRAAPLDLRPLVEDLQLRDGVLEMRLRVQQEGSARPREVLQALAIADLEMEEGGQLTRTRVEIET
ncbi:MAG TPA: TIGR03936 family radical SAM-associated protein [Pirellulales bacterium]|jgi:radical SAM-linked protein|nr:TIGR03936 family radical SAM-associated protein [Pirellulales bacterium]